MSKIKKMGDAIMTGLKTCYADGHDITIEDKKDMISALSECIVVIADEYALNSESAEFSTDVTCGSTEWQLKLSKLKKEIA
jgi:hypothetical protein